MTPPLLTDERLKKIGESIENNKCRERLRWGGISALLVEVYDALVKDRAELLRLREERTRLEKALDQCISATQTVYGMTFHANDFVDDLVTLDPPFRMYQSREAPDLAKYLRDKAAFTLKEPALPTLKEGEQPL